MGKDPIPSAFEVLHWIVNRMFGTFSMEAVVNRHCAASALVHVGVWPLLDVCVVCVCIVCGGVDHWLMCKSTAKLCATFCNDINNSHMYLFLCCMCACVYVVHVCVCVHMGACVCCACVYACMHLWVCACVYVYTCAHLNVCVRPYIAWPSKEKQTFCTTYTQLGELKLRTHPVVSTWPTCRLQRLGLLM